MNGWALKKVYKINNQLAIGENIEDAIEVYRLYMNDSNVEINSIELVYGDGLGLNSDAICREATNAE